MNAKFLSKVFFIMSLFSLTILIGCSSANNKQDKTDSLSKEYGLFWSAIPNTLSAKEEKEYHDYSVVFEDGLYLNIMAYNHKSGSQLSLDDFKEFLSDEKAADGSYRIEHIDSQINNYINWYHDVGKNLEIGLYEADLEDVYDEFRKAHDITTPSLKALNQEQLTEIMKKLDDSGYEIDASKWSIEN